MPNRSPTYVSVPKLWLRNLWKLVSYLTEFLGQRQIHILFLNRYGSTSFLGKAQCQFGINCYLAVHLSNGCINNTALLDAICGRDATSEDFGDSSYTIFIRLLWHHLGTCFCRLLLCILEEQDEFLSRHHADGFLQQLLYCN